MSKITPMIRQYLEIKKAYKDAILFFRMGDFYEMFFEDAKIASNILGITLTSRDKNKENSVPLCGFPYHSASAYISKLIDQGYKVAICEQIEDPNKAIGIVKREVVRVITPGLVVDTDAIEDSENNFLMSISSNKEKWGIAFVDLSTGEFKATEIVEDDVLIEETARIAPKEILAPKSLSTNETFLELLQSNDRYILTYIDNGIFEYEKNLKSISKQIKIELLEGLNPDDMKEAIKASGGIVHYIKVTQKAELNHINHLILYQVHDYMVLDEPTKRNLEIFSTMKENSKKGSLIQILDDTSTAMGSRKIRNWLNYPILSIYKIRERIDSVEELKDEKIVRKDLRGVLKEIRDLERINSRISLATINAKDLIQLKLSVKILPEIKGILKGLSSKLCEKIFLRLDDLTDIYKIIESSIAEDPPYTIREGGLIKEGYDETLDQLREIGKGGRSWIATLEAKERKKTRINSLKVGFNKVFGYYIEVTKANLNKVPKDYMRKQTLVNAERYFTHELKEYESTVLEAKEKQIELEFQLFNQVREQIEKQTQRIQLTSSLLAELDTLLCLAEVADRFNYVKPSINEEDRIVIIDGRHPVIEQMNLGERFVPNDITLDTHENQLIIITGPNMSGKSTIMRQVALIVLMAQIGSFVPAKEATIGLVDRIFTRVGASDNLAKGESTFMVEMNETANILRNASNKSLIIMDEIGRGTSTFDGVSIAWAVAEYIHDKEELQAKTLFATHYHELTELALTKDRVKNYNIAVKEWNDRIIFLRKLIQGGTNRSYGIQVARLAGLPTDIINRAKEILLNLERGELNELGMPKLALSRYKSQKAENYQLSLFNTNTGYLYEELKRLDISSITPLEALNKLNELKEMADRDK
ncbi:MAG: DNA mismatch repair protein MutS [Thermodesulfobacteriota bacterium]|nr:DNA mismatch repair protein MutS [Thermodesulfobacteriota bacterium]